jgi:hypothetical protein
MDKSSSINTSINNSINDFSIDIKQRLLNELSLNNYLSLKFKDEINKMSFNCLENNPTYMEVYYNDKVLLVSQYESLLYSIIYCFSEQPINVKFIRNICETITGKYCDLQYIKTLDFLVSFYTCFDHEYKTHICKNLKLKKINPCYIYKKVIDIDTINCIDSYNDNIEFIVGDKLNINEVKQKDVYTFNDLNIFFTLLKKYNDEDFVYQYFLLFKNIENHKNLLALIIKYLLYESKSKYKDEYLKKFVNVIDVDCLRSLYFMDLLKPYLKYINDDCKQDILKYLSKNDFSKFIKISKYIK